MRITKFKAIVLLLLASTILFSTAFAAASVYVNIEGRVKVPINQGPINAAVDIFDDASIEFTGTVDNIKAVATFDTISDCNGTDGDDSFADCYGVQVTGLFLEVTELFGGLLTLRFYDWDFCGGSGCYILNDTSYQGIFATLDPIDILTIRIAYGINKSERHGIFLAVDIGGPVPTSVFFGTILNNGSINRNHVLVDAAPGAIAVAGVEGNPETPAVAGTPAVIARTKILDGFGVESMAIGVEAKYQDFLGIGFGYVLPFGTAVTQYAYASDGTVDDSETNIDAGNFAVSIFGNPGPWDIGLGSSIAVDYGIQYVPDTISKFTSTLGLGTHPGTSESIIGGGDDYGALLIFSVNPQIFFGPMILSIPITFELYGTKYGDVEHRDSSEYTVEFAPALEYSPGPGYGVTFIYDMDYTGESRLADGTVTESDISHQIGLYVSANFGVSSE